MVDTNSRTVPMMPELFLKYFLPNNPNKFKDQFAFRETGSTSAAIIALTKETTRLLENNEYVRMVQLDFSKTFDTVRHKKLFDKLANFNIEDQIFNWMTDYFSGHKQRTLFNGEASTYEKINAGVIQGSAIGPFPFCVISSDLTSTRIM